MGAKRSAEMKHALVLVEDEKKTVYEAAKIANVSARAIYYALINNKNKKLANNA